jgi:hypothetical protein
MGAFPRIHSKAIKPRPILLAIWLQTCNIVSFFRPYQTTFDTYIYELSSSLFVYAAPFIAPGYLQSSGMTGSTPRTPAPTLQGKSFLKRFLLMRGYAELT